MAQLQTNDVLKRLTPNVIIIFDPSSPKDAIEAFALKKSPEFNSTQAIDPLKFFETTKSTTKIADIQTEQQKPAFRAEG